MTLGENAYGSRRVYKNVTISVREEHRLGSTAFYSIGEYKDAFNNAPLVVIDGKILGTVNEVRKLLDTYEAEQ